MVVVGLTGGIGSGKSTVAKRLSDHGAIIVDGDKIAREIVQPGEPALSELSEEFGSDILMSDGSLDRKELARRAFVSEDRTKALNAIMHPRIHERAYELFRASADASIVVFDMPLLIENNLDRMCGLVVVVTVDEDTRVDRLVAHRGFDQDDARQRIRAQLSDADRTPSADVIVDNSGTPDQLLESVDRLWDSRLARWGRVTEHDERASREADGLVLFHHQGRQQRFRRRVEWVFGSETDVEFGGDPDKPLFASVSRRAPGEGGSGGADESTREKLSWLGFSRQSGSDDHWSEAFQSDDRRATDDTEGRLDVWRSGDPIDPATIRL
ncbi:dephospho-CoA kinase [Corynebacterium sp.]|uniref:dephospho-CoA kinase n=1 Tax=Corynebacterium sp. TaxID=1720 RepID=UPI0026DAE76B|nr:dephospho-CoA kinase [Corynebacterium sp.]MDO4914929.1 dephospho-CoA kinase [Corynebacterium sp.]